MSQQQFLPTPKFEEYKERFKDFYKMQRRVDGVILVEAHTNGGPIQLSVENHRSVGQMLKTVGADPENEIPKVSNWRPRICRIGPTSTPTRMAASTSVQWSTISKFRRLG
jgi:hypothetical protein